MEARELTLARLRRVSPRIWMAECDPAGSANAGIVVGDERVLVVDTRVTPGFGRELAEAVCEATGRTTAELVVVNTHFHGDHVFGNGAFRGATFVASAATQRAQQEQWAQQIAIFEELRPHQAAEIAGAEQVPATIGVDGSCVLDLGGIEVRLEPVGPAHTPGDVAVFADGEDVVFVADLVFSGHWPAMWDADIAGWLASLQRLRDVAPATVVPGHGPPGGPELLDAMADCLRFLVELERAGGDEDAVIDRSAFAGYLHRRRVAEARQRVREQLPAGLGALESVR